MCEVPNAKHRENKPRFIWTHPDRGMNWNEFGSWNGLEKIWINWQGWNVCVRVCVGGDGWGGVFLALEWLNSNFAITILEFLKKFLSVQNQRPQNLEEGRYRNEAYTHFSFFIRNLVSVVVLKVSQNFGCFRPKIFLGLSLVFMIIVKNLLLKSLQFLLISTS